MIEVRTQAELGAALKSAKPGELIACIGNGEFAISGSSTVRASDSSMVHASDSSTVHAYNSSMVHASDSSTVHAYNSSTVHASGSSTVHAYDSSTVRAYDSSTVRASGSSTVRASGSSTVHAYGSSTVHAYDSSTVHAYKYVGVTRLNKKATVTGGVLIDVPEIKTAAEWCDYYGVEVKAGVATLYKAVDDDYSTTHGRSHGVAYKPGTKPKAPDWDSGKAECGGGLHFSPRPWMGREFNGNATKYVACPVLLSEIVVHKNAQFPNKVKAPRVYGKVYECDEDGNKIKAGTA